MSKHCESCRCGDPSWDDPERDTIDTQARRDIAALHVELTRALATAGIAQGLCEALAMRVEALESSRGPALTGNGLTALEEKLSADRDAWKARAESAEAMVVRLEGDRDRMRAVVEAARSAHTYAWRQFTGARGEHNCGGCPLCLLWDALKTLAALEAK